MTDQVVNEIESLRQHRESLLIDLADSLKREDMLSKQLSECQAREKATPKSNYGKGVFNPVFDMVEELK